VAAGRWPQSNGSAGMCRSEGAAGRGTAVPPPITGSWQLAAAGILTARSFKPAGLGTELTLLLLLLLLQVCWRW
jgi:hypothetical protein